MPIKAGLITQRCGTPLKCVAWLEPSVLAVSKGFCPCNRMGLVVVEKRYVGRAGRINSFKAEATQRPVPIKQRKNTEEK